MRRNTRIKDLAERLGVSTATVSRALAGSELVAEPTRTRIREEAEKLDYRPNVSARNLRTRRSMAVLVVVRDIGNPFYLDVLKGVEAEARKAGYSVLMGNTENSPEREAEYFNMLRDAHADGMILITGKMPSGFRPLAPGQDYPPIVVASEPIDDSPFPHVIIDNEGASAEAVRHLISLGHTRIAHIAGPVPEPLSVRRREGYRRALDDAGLQRPESYEQRGDYLLESGAAASRALMALAEPPTAIFAANDEMAFGAINALRMAGKRVPEDVSVVGFDNIYFSGAFYPPLTTVSQPRMEMGRAAMAIVLTLLQGRKPPRQTLELPTELIVRQTTAAPRGG